MGKNIKQGYYSDSEGRIQFEGDWYGKGLPGNVAIGENVYLFSSMGFERIVSVETPALVIGNEVGIYDQFLFEIGKNGTVELGDYTIFKGRMLCNEQVKIGKYCMISWGVYITDSWPQSAAARQRALSNYIVNPEATMQMEYTAPVVLEDNVWIGFDSVIMPGVTIGEGAIVSSKTIVDKDVEPYSVVGGSPMRVIKYLEQ